MRAFNAARAVSRRLAHKQYTNHEALGGHAPTKSSDRPLVAAYYHLKRPLAGGEYFCQVLGRVGWGTHDYTDHP